MSKIKLAIAGLIVAVGFSTAIVEVRANRALRAEYRSLQSETSRLPGLETENARLGLALSGLGGQNPEVGELERLRRRLTVLRARPEGVVDAEFLPIANLGRSTPESAFATLFAALNAGDLDAAAASIAFRDDTPENREAFLANFTAAWRTRYRTPERIFAAAYLKVQEGKPYDAPSTASSFQVLSAVEDYPGYVTVNGWVKNTSGHEFPSRNTFLKSDHGWGLVIRPLADQRTIAEIKKGLDPVTGEPRPNQP